MSLRSWEPLGTVVLPLLGVPFGWAKPVPINPLRFTRAVSMKTGVLLVSLAGPVSNLVLALLSTAVLGVLVHYFPAWVATHVAVFQLIWHLVLINCALALFNLLPIPPLDGGGVADALVPQAWRGAWEEFRRLAPFALVAVIVLPMLSGGHSVLEWPLQWINQELIRFLHWLC